MYEESFHEIEFVNIIFYIYSLYIHNHQLVILIKFKNLENIIHNIILVGL